MNVLRGWLLDYLEFRGDDPDYLPADHQRARDVLQGMGGLMGEW